jgi:hypothetical protein
MGYPNGVSHILAYATQFDTIPPSAMHSKNIVLAKLVICSADALTLADTQKPYVFRFS